METHKIEAHKITKPIQLMAVWFVALLLIDSAFLTAAVKIRTPPWLAPTLVISAIVFVPLFLIGVFLMQTVFRKELQDDQFYSEWLKRQEDTFEDFAPENILPNGGIKINVPASAGRDYALVGTNLEERRIKSYEDNKGLFLVHTWRPSITPGQVADIVIWLQQHRKGLLSEGRVEKVEYQLGDKFFDGPKVKTNSSESFRLEVSAYGPMLCVARVYIKDDTKPIILKRYVNIEEAPSKALQPTVISVRSSEDHPIKGATVVAIAENDTTKSGTTNNDGIVELVVSTRLVYKILIAHPEYPGAIIHTWDPGEDVNIALAVTENTGSEICMSTGYIPGLSGRLSPILDTSDRTYLYADNIAIDGGKNQPATFRVDEPFELEDADGVVMQVRVLHIQGSTSLLQYVRARYD